MLTLKLANLYVEEGMYSELLSLVERIPAYAKHYGRRLEKRYPREIGLVYIALAKENMEYPGGRQVYREKCGLLQSAKRLGCEKEVKELVGTWRKHYERRRALLEELGSV